jgi:hypothetical protein
VKHWPVITYEGHIRVHSMTFAEGITSLMTDSGRTGFIFFNKKFDKHVFIFFEQKFVIEALSDESF